MNGDSASTPVPPGSTASSPIVLPLTEIGKATGQWTLTLHPAHLALADAPGAQPYIILREAMMKSAILIEGTRAFVLRQPRKLMFKLTPEGASTLAQWIGKPVLASTYLKRQYSWMLPWAIVWVLGSLTTLIPSRSDPTPFSPAGLAVALALLGACAFAKWRPHPALFLASALWFAWVAVHFAVSVMHGRSKVWLILAVSMAWLAVNGFRHFIRFRGTRLEPQRK